MGYKVMHLENFMMDIIMELWQRHLQIHNAEPGIPAEPLPSEGTSAEP
jgi:hypothetical protein